MLPVSHETKPRSANERAVVCAAASITAGGLAMAIGLPLFEVLSAMVLFGIMAGIFTHAD